MRRGIQVLIVLTDSNRKYHILSQRVVELQSIQKKKFDFVNVYYIYI